MRRLVPLALFGSLMLGAISSLPVNSRQPSETRTSYAFHPLVAAELRVRDIPNRTPTLLRTAAPVIAPIIDEEKWVRTQLELAGKLRPPPPGTVPEPSVSSVKKSTSTPHAQGQDTGEKVSGPASWYCNRDGSRAVLSVCHYQYPDRLWQEDLYAAAGPALRRAMCGDVDSDCWRGQTVRVNGITIKLVDYCQCYRGLPKEKVIDLYYDAWLVAAAPRSGFVEIDW